MAKDRVTGKAVIWDPIPNEGWVDGSVDNDLPMNRLAEMFCVNHFIVSQVNPHVVPFLAKEEEDVSAAVKQNAAASTGPGWMHNLAAFAKGEAIHRLDMLAEIGVFPNAVTKARSVLNQRYSGDITIFPEIHYTNFPKILTNPTTEYMLRSMRNGERATWSKVSRVQNHVAVELALDKTINLMASRVVFSPNQINLRLLNFTRHPTQKHDSARHTRLNKSEHIMNLAAQAAPSVEITAPSFRRHLSPESKLPPQSTAKSGLSTHSSRATAQSLDFSKHSCSTADAASTDLDSSGDEDYYSNDSNASEPASSPSPSCSPPRPPELWPSARQVPLNPFSNPSTPSLSSAAFGHRYHSSISARIMPSATPSSPELLYKRLFHPSPGTSPSGSPRMHSSLQPLPEMSSEMMTPLGLQRSPPPADMFGTDIFEDNSVLAFNPPVFSPAMSPRMTALSPRMTAMSPRIARDDSRANKAKASQRQENAMDEAEQATGDGQSESAQGLGLGLGLDYSGTRGMMLRRQQSRSNGFYN
jgi:TAG lipase/steryl ester hydrolase/phospholipase A2/LPA acyltransferase